MLTGVGAKVSGGALEPWSAEARGAASGASKWWVSFDCAAEQCVGEADRKLLLQRPIVLPPPRRQNTKQEMGIWKRKGKRKYQEMDGLTFRDYLFLLGLVSKIGYNIEEAAARQRVFYYQVSLSSGRNWILPDQQGRLGRGYHRPMGSLFLL